MEIDDVRDRARPTPQPASADMANEWIPFNVAHVAPEDEARVIEALRSGHLCGDGDFTRQCHEIFKDRFGVAGALLTHSCTAALEMTALLLELEPGDEVILPSYTFVSTANAFVLRGATPVFVDVRPDTLNIDEAKIEAAVTDRTKAIVTVHYAGVPCEMDAINAIARKHGFAVIEDAAQAYGSTYKGRPAGALADMAAFSFHHTKNISAGEGGALLCRDEALARRAEILREKGTNRSAMERGEVDKYTWVDIGSSYLPSELNAALLLGQLERADRINARRLEIWRTYNEALAENADDVDVTLPTVPADCRHNGHCFYFLAPDETTRNALIAHFKTQGVKTVFHYVPLHSSTGGEKFGRTSGDMSVTDDVWRRLVRLPLYVDLTDEQVARVIAAYRSFWPRSA
ncbi:MAG: dTDP-4-amino-4,6-dideoxygalactose transaminase [Maricaulaceae bacterium]|jgi:dTDP-4-amino-4,6-dideoxygalactose transaminase